MLMTIMLAVLLLIGCSVEDPLVDVGANAQVGVLPVGGLTVPLME